MIVVRFAPPPLVLACLVGASALALAAGTSARARTELATARADLALTTDGAQELLRLRAVAPAEPVARRPAAGLQPRIAGVLAACGLPSTTLASLAPEPESTPGPGLRGQHATLVLAPVTLPQVGAFLAAWRAAEPEWTAASIELGQAGAPRDPGGDLPLRAVVQIESVYAADPPTPPTPPTPLVQESGGPR